MQTLDFSAQRAIRIEAGKPNLKPAAFAHQARELYRLSLRAAFLETID